jgi:hypothetical protein
VTEGLVRYVVECAVIFGSHYLDHKFCLFFVPDFVDDVFNRFGDETRR